MNMTIGSQMTQDEIEDYGRRMLALVGDGVEPQARVAIVLNVINVCGRPIAKAEQEMIADASRRREHELSVPKMPMVVDGPFGARFDQ